MYNPPHFREERVEVMHDLMQAYPLSILITNGPAGLIANPVPMTLVASGTFGLLRAHLAKANPQLAELREGGEVLVVFQGSAAYVTPSWYASKAEHGKVVPTWNYTIVQARGRPRMLDDVDWLRSQIETLTDDQEVKRTKPWAVGDAPEAFLEGQMKGITGVEIPIDHLTGKWKVSQNKPTADRLGVAAGLRQETDNSVIAGLVDPRAS